MWPGVGGEAPRPHRGVVRVPAQVVPQVLVPVPLGHKPGGRRDRGSDGFTKPRLLRQLCSGLQSLPPFYQQTEKETSAAMMYRKPLRAELCLASEPYPRSYAKSTQKHVNVAGLYLFCSLCKGLHTKTLNNSSLFNIGLICIRPNTAVCIMLSSVRMSSVVKSNIRNNQEYYEEGNDNFIENARWQVQPTMIYGHVLACM